MTATHWKVTVGTLATIAVVSGGFTASLIATRPGPFDPITVGQKPVATPSSPAASQARAGAAQVREAASAKSAAKPAKKSQPKPSSPRLLSSASSFSADSAD